MVIPRPLSKHQLQELAALNSLLHHGRYDAERLVFITGLVYGVDKKEMLSPLRWARYVKARTHAAWLIWTLNKRLSKYQIGKLFNRDRTTILHGLQKYQADPTAFAKEHARILFLIEIGHAKPQQRRLEEGNRAHAL